VDYFHTGSKVKTGGVSPLVGYASQPRIQCILIIACLVFYTTRGITQIRADVVGWLENSYRTSETSHKSGANSSYSEYLQNYQVGLNGFVLSNNFLSYYLGTHFEESQRNDGNTFWRTRTFDWYDFTGHFFSNRRVALDLFLRRSQTDAYLPTGLDRRYEDLVGGELHLRTWWLPITRSS
jgi:hypothetical protein